MKLLSSITILLFFQIVSCQIPKKESINQLKKTSLDTLTYASVNFFDYLEEGHRVDLDGKILISSFINCDKKCSIANLYLIHKDGGIKWIDSMNVKYRKINEYNKKNYGYLTGAERLMKEDSTLLRTEFDAWAFFTDKKWLKIGYESVEDGSAAPYYYHYENSEAEIIVYQRLAGEKKWREIDRKKFKTDEYGDIIDDEYWEEKFMEKKVKENNAN